MMARAAYFIAYGATVTAFAVLIIVPLGALVVALRDTGVTAPSSFLHAFTLLPNSLALAGSVTALASVMGLFLALALDCARVPFRRVLWAGVAIAFVVPPYIAAIAWIELTGVNGAVPRLLRDMFGVHAAWPSLYSLPGASFVLSLSYCPVPAAACTVAIRRIDRAVEEAGALFASQRRRLMGIVLPMLLPALATGALIVFLLALVNFNVPSLLQVRVYPVEVHNRFAAFYDVRGAALLSMPLAAVGLIVGLLWRAYVGPRRAWFSGEARPPQQAAVSPAMRYWFFIFALILVGPAAVPPILVHFLRSLPLESYREVWRTAADELGTSLFIAALAATLMTALAFFMVVLGWSRAVRQVFFSLSGLAFLISGPALAIGLIAFWNKSDARALVYDTITVVVLVCAARYLVFAYAGLAYARNALDRRSFEAAAVFGVPAWRQWFALELPLLSPALVAVWGLAFILAFGEVDAAVLLTPPGITTLPVRIFGLMHYGPGRLVSALSVIVVAVLLALGAGAMVAARLAVRWTHGPDRP